MGVKKILSLLAMLPFIAQAQVQEGGSTGPSVPASGYAADSIEVSVDSAFKREGNKDVRVIMTLTNRGDEAIRVMFIHPRAVMMDNQGSIMKGYDSSGIQACHANVNKLDWSRDAYWCLRETAGRYTTLYPGVSQKVIMRFMAGIEDATDESLEGDYGTLTARLHVVGEEGSDVNKQIDISLSSIALQ